MTHSTFNYENEGFILSDSTLELFSGEMSRKLKKKISDHNYYNYLKSTSEGRSRLRNQWKKRNGDENCKKYRRDYYRNRRREDDNFRINYNQISKKHRDKFTEINGATYSSVRGENDSIFRMKRNISNNLNKFLKTKYLNKNSQISKYIDATSDFLRSFIEQQFKTGMNWNNYGVVWHLDHVRPLTSFDFNDGRQIYVANNWRNLQPLFVKDNLEKSDRYSPKDEASWIKRMHKYQFEGDLFLKFSN